MSGWLLTDDPVDRVLRLRLPEHISAAVARDAVTALVSKLDGEHLPSIVIADLRTVRHFDPEAPIVAALICSRAVGNIEHLYIVSYNPLIRCAAAAAASSIGLEFTCRAEEPDLEALRLSGMRLVPNVRARSA